MNYPKDKGTRSEGAVARWITANTGVTMKRTAQYGAGDQGDLEGLHDVVVEVKDRKTCRLPKWAAELERECHNAAKPYGVVLWSPPGLGPKSVDRWVAIEWPSSHIGQWVSGKPAIYIGPITKLAAAVAQAPATTLYMAAEGTTHVKIRQAHLWVADLIEHLAAAA